VKATFVWVSGPLREQEASFQKTRRVEMGPPGPNRLVVPDAMPGAAWAVVTLQNGRCFLTNTGAPVPLSITRKVSGQLQVFSANPNDILETKTHDVLQFGPDGPAVYCTYELEPADMAGINLQDLPEAVSPVTAQRRRQIAEDRTAASKEEMEQMKNAVAAAKQNVDVQLKEERRQSRVEIYLLGGVAAAALVGVAIWLVLWMRSTEEKMAERLKGLAGDLEKSRASFEENAKRLESVREEAKKELSDLLAAAEKEKDDAKLQDLRQQIEACRLELKDNKPLEEKFAAMQADIDAGLLFLVARVKVAFTQGGRRYTDVLTTSGTGFLIDSDGTVITCKHVVQPWKFREMAGIIEVASATVLDCALEAYPVGTRYDPSDAAGKRAPYSIANGKLKLVRTAPDSLVTIQTAVEGRVVSVEVEGNYENDLAVLQVNARGLKPLALAGDAEMSALKKKKLSPVCVAGFPLGINAFDNERVASSMTLGNVRKFERFIQHSAPTCGGNSGGPLIGVDGRVVGVVSFALTGPVSQNLNACVPAAQVRKLLNP
jgi:S1-C subfamily serine protease